MHQWGINLRLLGFVRSLFKIAPEQKKLHEDELRPLMFSVETARASLLVEMIARTSKSYIRSVPLFTQHKDSHHYDYSLFLGLAFAVWTLSKRPLFSLWSISMSFSGRVVQVASSGIRTSLSVSSLSHFAFVTIYLYSSLHEYRDFSNPGMAPLGLSKFNLRPSMMSTVRHASLKRSLRLVMIFASHSRFWCFSSSSKRTLASSTISHYSLSFHFTFVIFLSGPVSLPCVVFL